MFQRIFNFQLLIFNYLHYMTKEKLFTSYQIFYIAVSAILQFLIVLDFMVLSPLGAQLMPSLHISPKQFGLVVSAYAFSAGASGLLAAGFADRFDRKKLLLFFFGGFIAGTFLCGIATGYWFLLVARVVTGIFGGVVGSIGFAVITDLFAAELRGRVMGLTQMSFAAAQVLGLPVGLYLANLWDWHAPFLLIVAIAIPLWLLLFWKMQPVREHLTLQSDRSAFQHLWHTASNPFYLRAFAATTLLATGGFMLMPFGAAFGVNNLGISMGDLPKLYLITGLTSMASGPVIGKLVDRFGAIYVFWGGSVLAITMVLIYTNLSVTPLWILIALSAAMFVGVTTRMISVSVLISVVPVPADRGAFMSINNSISQISGGIASAVAGMIVYQTASGHLENYPMLGLVVSVTMVICGVLTWGIWTAVQNRAKEH
jgi:predicted MFS family arabinose efflux permease